MSSLAFLCAVRPDEAATAMASRRLGRQPLGQVDVVEESCRTDSGLRLAQRSPTKATGIGAITMGSAPPAQDVESAECTAVRRIFACNC
jgi:hypothetical protein